MHTGQLIIVPLVWLGNTLQFWKKKCILMCDWNTETNLTFFCRREQNRNQRQPHTIQTSTVSSSPICANSPAPMQQGQHRLHCISQSNLAGNLAISPCSFWTFASLPPEPPSLHHGSIQTCMMIPVQLCTDWNGGGWGWVAGGNFGGREFMGGGEENRRGLGPGSGRFSRGILHHILHSLLSSWHRSKKPHMGSWGLTWIKGKMMRFKHNHTFFSLLIQFKMSHPFGMEDSYLNHDSLSVAKSFPAGLKKMIFFSHFHIYINFPLCKIVNLLLNPSSRVFPCSMTLAFLSLFSKASDSKEMVAASDLFRSSALLICFESWYAMCIPKLVKSSKSLPSGVPDWHNHPSFSPPLCGTAVESLA